MRPLPPLLIAPLAATLAAPFIASCVLGGEGMTSAPYTPYDQDLAQLRSNCEQRGGMLLPSGRSSGVARADTVCLITDHLASPARPAKAPAERV